MFYLSGKFRRHFFVDIEIQFKTREGLTQNYTENYPKVIITLCHNVVK